MKRGASDNTLASPLACEPPKPYGQWSATNTQSSPACSAADPQLPTAALLTGSVTGKERTRLYNGLADGSIGIVVGTHALIAQKVEFKRLGLAVVDEQHRWVGSMCLCGGC